jgi:endonuclease III-like uncharacterized protein
LVEFETWQEVAKEVRELSYKKVNIFRSVISFTPQTAAELLLKIIRHGRITLRSILRFLLKKMESVLKICPGLVHITMKSVILISM